MGVIGLSGAVYSDLEDAFRQLFNQKNIAGSIDKDHIEDTPRRIAKMYEELYSGCDRDPKEVLQRTFKNKGYDEIIYVNDMRFISSCAHHGLPFIGKAHFAYLPRQRLVGLSKIPRLLEILAHRPQVQEKLTIEMVDTFMGELYPLGCGIVMEAIHCCMSIRGVENHSAYTKTTAIRGVFKEPTVKAEFLDGVRKSGGQLWP